MANLVKNIIAKQGEFKVNSAHLMYDNGRVAIIEIDCKTKYPSVMMVGGDDTYVLHLTKGTDIFIELSSDECILFTECSRYTIFVTIVKSGIEAIESWDFNNEDLDIQ